MQQFPFTAEEFRTIYSKVPRVTVEVVIAHQGGIVLSLRKLESWKNLWHIPGGTILYKETVEQALQRIAREELNISIQIHELLGYIEYPSEEKERGFGWSVGLAFLCTTKDEIPQINDMGEEIQVFRSFPTNMVEEQRPIVEKALSFISQ